MKILCIFLAFVFTVSCGPSVPQKNTREVAERKRECQLVRGACKPECNSWEYVYYYCGVNPCCVVREYKKPTPAVWHEYKKPIINKITTKLHQK
ncbi:LOW QUALITY PROTEIN: beta-defensin 113 [Saimiri boliviensis]|uniref:LOW QUALITY PROTEIN: beta-defensin 113 n=1 Tax=Saimiri boliviensis TaxID=27679 RepID=UPI00193E711A|nr:LOW QUALITY PROTEIN: beta-defensin 113 [Saimiri boliviensis boliviensis]